MPYSPKPPGMSIADWLDTAFHHFLAARELAPILDCSLTDLYDMARDGAIPHVRMRGKVRFDPHAIANWLRAHEV